MLEYLDALSELVYISDPVTYDLLYVNRVGLEKFHIDLSQAPVKCYRALQGLDAPCPFCTTPQLTHSETYAWEYYNPVVERHYLLRDTLIDWQGRPARMEVALDISSQKEETRATQNAFSAEKMVLHCVRHLHQEEDLSQGIRSMLRQLGEELSAERTYIFDVVDDLLYDRYEWCAPGIAPQIDRLQRVDTALIQRWIPFFDRGECVIIRDVEEIRDCSPDEYEILAAQGIHRMVSAPLEQDGVLNGFIGVDNPAPDKIRNIAPLLNTLRYFLMTTISRMEDARRLEQLSYQDILTGLLNRNRYLWDLEKLRQRSGLLGVVYADLNGLKEINDHEGHAAGDAALIYCAAQFRLAFPLARLYRIGGDEFVILQSDINQADFDGAVAALRTHFDGDCRYQIALGTCWGEGTNPDQMILAADTAMYEDKRRFYLCHSSSRYRSFPSAEESTLFTEYNLLMSSMHVSVSKHIMRADFPVLWANDSFYALLGYSREEFESRFGNSCLDYFTGDQAQYTTLCATVLDAFNAGKPGYELMLHLPRKGGDHIWVRLVGTFTDVRSHGRPVVYAVMTDVNDLVRIQREQTATYDSLPGFAARIRIGRKVPHLLHGNQQFMHFFAGQVPCDTSALLRSNLKRNQAVLARHYGQLRAGESVLFEISAQGAQGELCHFQVCGSCVDWMGDDPVYLLLFIDVTELTSQREVLRQLVFVDPVTGGMNRTCFEQEAGGAMSTAPPNTYAVISLDIQKFKVINDLFGIESGDRVLSHVHRQLRSALREGEFVARLSSDTFSLLLWADDPARMESRISDMAARINSFNHNLERKFLITLAAGICLVDDPQTPMTRLQDRATIARKQIRDFSDACLYVCRFYSSEDSLRMNREKDVENRMRDALEQGEFVVYLQPKQDLNSGAVAGAEALVRWIDPVQGMILPDLFIPLFEKNGFIVDLDLYVFDRVCALLAGWIDQGLCPIPISVNLSRRHLSNIHFLERYEEIRLRYGVPPSLLEIELTETLVFENPKLLTQIIDDIHRSGYRCSMDDFGSGYSSLNMLKDIRVDVLKLDRAFFSSAQVDNPSEAAVISVVVDLGRRLQMKTIAEGVETESQAAFLRQAGCDMIQGFLFSRPLPIPAFEELVFGISPIE